MIQAEINKAWRACSNRTKLCQIRVHAGALHVEVTEAKRVSRVSS